MSLPPTQPPPDQPPAAAPSRRPVRSAAPKQNWTITNGIVTILTVAVLAASLFTLWTPANLFSNQMLDQMFAAWQAAGTPAVTYPTATPADKPVIGIVAGHWKNDSGAVCDDGLTEQEVNLKIATLVQQKLKKEGYIVDLLSEFDPLLSGYRALLLVSIHNDSCMYVNDEATGFKVTAAMTSAYPERAARLTACLSTRYAETTKLSYHFGSVTMDMTDYHTFNEINTETTAAIIETGFLNLDRDILTNQTDLIAQGVVNGILCFTRNEDLGKPTSQP